MDSHGWLVAVRAFTAAVLLVAGAARAEAQLVDCSGSLSGGNVFQVYLDELSYTKATLKSDPVFEQLARRLSFKLGSNVEAVTLERIPVPLAFAFCEERKPSGTAQFRKSLIDALDDDSVILELWGQLDATEVNQTITERKAKIGYVLIPVLLEDYDRLRNTGFQFVEYPKDQPATGELVDLMERSVELEAFVAVGVGVDLFREAKYDEALGYLCRAKILLEQGPVGIPDGQRTALVDYISGKARQTVAKARTGSDYQRALVELVDPADPCPQGSEEP